MIPTKKENDRAQRRGNCGSRQCQAARGVGEDGWEREENA